MYCLSSILVDIAKTMKDTTGILISPITIRRRLTDSGLKNCIACKKPYISEANRRKRVVWAKEHVSWGVDRWEKVLWSDESPYVLQYQGLVRVWRRRGERYHPCCLKGTVKHDKKIMVWGCMSANGVGDFIRIFVVLVKEKYRQILIHNAVPSGKRLLGRGFIFQQDNDPKHTAKIVKKYLKNRANDHTLEVLDWPSQSPDLSPIENLWQILDTATKNRKPSSEEQLFEVLKAAWAKIDSVVLKKLVRSMKQRCEAVIANNGFPTKY